MSFTEDKRNRNGASRNFKWVAVVVMSALVGSGATISAQHAMNSRVTAKTDFPTAASVNTQATGLNMSFNGNVTSAVKKVEPDVVGVLNYAQVSNFFSQQSKLEATGVGTGAMFYKDKQYAYLVTNNHVVEGAAKVDIVLNPGKHVNAQVVGTDPYTDLAVLKVPANTFKGVDPARFANSDTIQPGEPAIAIGTPMGLDFADTVTSGIVSAKSRVMPVQDEQSQQTLDYQTVIQTDAAINPGNSGGPLCNIKGEVIGINSSKIVAPNFEGMGFAIPANEVQTIAKQLMTTGHAQHPALGVQAFSLASLPQQMWPDVPVDYGVWVKAVTSKQSQESGLRPGDVIVAMNGRTIRTMADLRTYLFRTKPGDTVTLKVFRGYQAKNIKLKVGSMNTELTTSNREQPEASNDPVTTFGGLFQ